MKKKKKVENNWFRTQFFGLISHNSHKRAPHTKQKNRIEVNAFGQEEESRDGKRWSHR